MDELANAKAARALVEVQLAAAIKERDALRIARNDAIEYLVGCFSQACSDYDRVTGKHSYDHMCLSAYEGTQDFLISVGAIKKEDCRRT